MTEMPLTTDKNGADRNRSISFSLRGHVRLQQVSATFFPCQWRPNQATPSGHVQSNQSEWRCEHVLSPTPDPWRFIESLANQLRQSGHVETGSTPSWSILCTESPY